MVTKLGWVERYLRSGPVQHLNALDGLGKWNTSKGLSTDLEEDSKLRDNQGRIRSKAPALLKSFCLDISKNSETVVGQSSKP